MAAAKPSPSVAAPRSGALTRAGGRGTCPRGSERWRFADGGTSQPGMRSAAARQSPWSDPASAISPTAAPRDVAF
jgi:hypothetical protein